MNLRSAWTFLPRLISVMVSVGTSICSTHWVRPRRLASLLIESRTLFSKPE